MKILDARFESSSITTKTWIVIDWLDMAISREMPVNDFMSSFTEKKRTLEMQNTTLASGLYTQLTNPNIRL